MSRRHLSFMCEGSTLAGTLDDAPGQVGLLWVSGGNEIRSGPFAGQSRMAAQIAEAGYPVFRFDRRGVGDSEGENRGFQSSAPDISASLEVFRSDCPSLSRVIAFGNCDAASALMLSGGEGLDALVLANPWTFQDEDDLPPPAAIRARYASKLRDPSEWRRLLGGGVSLRKLADGLRRAAQASTPATPLAKQIANGLSRFAGSVRILIAERDRTGQAFLAGWDRSDPRLARCSGASHAFVETHAREWLLGQILSVLADEQTR